LEDARSRARGLTVAQLRQQLADRSVGWADLYEKSELVDRLAGLVAADLAFCPSGRVPIGKVADLGEADARAELADTSTPMLLDVYAKWCGPCQMMAPLLDGLAAEMRGQVRVIKLDSDTAVTLASELNVRGLPTLIAYREGKAVRRVEGALSAKALRELCDEYLLT
jgi:thioredoxin